MGGEPESLAPVGLSRLGIALAAAATIVAAAPPAATAAPSPRQGLRPSFESRRFRGHPPPPPRTQPPPTQAEVSRVIDQNRSGLTVCYQRALARDNRLTEGTITVKLSIGISGRVKQVGIAGLPPFRSLLEPCIKEAASRWVFPQASEEYGAEFPVIFHGNDDDDGDEPGDGCSISVNTVPWSEVWIDGMNTTLHTPVVRFRLPCGKHKLTFKRPDMHIDQTETITVRPGKRFRQQYALTTYD